jgi:hypothetical protein
MDDKAKKKQSDVSQRTDTDNNAQIAVPYMSPPPPDGSTTKFFKSPAMNGAILACVILLVGFMAYNYTAHEQTKVSDASIEVTAVPTPSLSPTATPSPYPSSNP